MLQFAISVMLFVTDEPRSAFQVKYWHSGTQGNPHDWEGASGNDQSLWDLVYPVANSGTFTYYHSMFPCLWYYRSEIAGRSVPKVPRNNISDPRTKTGILFRRDGLRVDANWTPSRRTRFLRVIKSCHLSWARRHTRFHRYGCNQGNCSSDRGSTFHD